MGFSKVLVWGGLVAGALYLTRGLKTMNVASSLLSEIKGAKFVGIKSGNILIDLVFSHTNPTNNQLNLNYMFLDLKVGENKIGEVREQNLNFLIKPNAVTSQTVRVSTSILSLGVALAKLIYSGKLPESLTVVGTLKANNFSQAFNEVIPFKKQDENTVS